MGGTGPAAEGLGVLEQEVLVEPFSEMCQAAGFAQVHVCPIAYVIPEFELSLEEWRAWRRLSRLKRPFRAADKKWRALLEFVGAGKKTARFVEAFAMPLVPPFPPPPAEHPLPL